MAVGMSVNVKILTEQPLLVLGLVVGLVGLKFAVLMVAARMAGLSGASAVAMGIALSQGGEFAYVIFQSATTQGVMGEETSLLVMVVTLSMVVTPLLFLVFDAWVFRLAALRLSFLGFRAQRRSRLSDSLWTMMKRLCAAVHRTRTIWIHL